MENAEAAMLTLLRGLSVSLRSSPSLCCTLSNVCISEHFQFGVGAELLEQLLHVDFGRITGKSAVFDDLNEAASLPPRL